MQNATIPRFSQLFTQLPDEPKIYQQWQQQGLEDAWKLYSSILARYTRCLSEKANLFIRGDQIKGFAEGESNTNWILKKKKTKWLYHSSGPVAN